MNNNKLLGIMILVFTAVVAILTVAATAVGATSDQDPYRVISVTKEVAAQNCRDLVDSALAPRPAGQTTTAQPAAVVADAVDGTLETFYDVQFTDASCQVDVHTGRVIGMTIAENVPFSNDVRIPLAQATQIADSFLNSHGIPTQGLVASAQLVNHREASDYQVEWSSAVNGALTPDNREVSVNPANGSIVGFADHRHPYSAPPSPRVSQSAAESAALHALGAHTEDVPLVVEIGLVRTSSGC